MDHTSQPYHAPFGPDTPITRLEMALIVGRALGEDQSDSGGTDGEQPPPLSFTDAPQVPTAYEGFVRTASEYGVLRGYDDGSFGPDRHTTRREAAVVYGWSGIRSSVFHSNTPRDKANTKQR